MSTPKTRTSLSLSGDALEQAQQRREALGYASLSEYIEFLILEDARQKRSHSIVRDESGVRYVATSSPEKTPPDAPPGESEPTTIFKDAGPASPGSSFRGPSASVVA